MPSIATHYIFSQDTALKLSSTSHVISTTIRNASGAYNAGAQGPDIFFYDIMHLAIAGKPNNIGSHMHVKKTDIFFMNYIKEIFKQNYYSSTAVRAYLMGFLTHYSLDTCIHPYVYSVTTTAGNSKKAVKTSLNAHCQLESDIDELLYYERFHNTINYANRSDFFNINDEQIKEIAPVLSAAINKTYGCNISASYIVGTFKRAKFTDNLLQDTSGLKKKIFAPLEKRITGSNTGSSLIFNTELPDRTCLNEEHRVWRVPATGKLCTDSFYEMYDKAIKRAIYLITKYNSCLNDIYELCIVNDNNISHAGSGNNDMINKYNNIHNTKALTSAIFSNPDLAISQLANDFVKTFGHDTKGLSYHTGINWRLGS